MAGNTRGKLKEQFEGIHRNMDWALTHINKSLALLATKLIETGQVKVIKDNPEQQEKLLEKNAIYFGMKSLGEGIATLDNLAMQVYAKL